MADDMPSIQQTTDKMRDFERRSSPAFKTAGEMEEPADAIKSYAITLCRIAEMLTGTDARVIERLGIDIGREIDAIEELRAALFRQIHPPRERLYREVW